MRVRATVPAAVIALLAAVAIESRAANGLIVYVAADGNDAWSGTRDAPTAQKNDGPFLTLDRARDEIRKRKRGGRIAQGGRDRGDRRR